MTRRSLLPVCLLLSAVPAFALSTDVPDEEETTLPPLVVHPGPDPLGDPIGRLRKTLPDLGYREPKKRSRLAEDINEGTDFQRQFFTQMLMEDDPRLDGPPAPYLTEGDGELADRLEAEFAAAKK
jgi:hypothetical protein